MMPITPNTDYDRDDNGTVDFQDLPEGSRWDAPPEDDRSNILKVKRLQSMDILEERKRRREEEEYQKIIDEEKEFQRLENRTPTRKKIDSLIEGGSQYIKRKITPQESQFLQQHRPAPVQQAAPRYKKPAATGRRGRAPTPRQQGVAIVPRQNSLIDTMGLRGANLDVFNVGGSSRNTPRAPVDHMSNFHNILMPRMPPAPAPRGRSPARMQQPRQPSTDMLKNFNVSVLGIGAAPGKKKKGRGGLDDFSRRIGGF